LKGDLDMNGNVRPDALITGASSGIGLELAKVFASEGHDLIISSDNRGKLQAAKQQITAQSPGVNIDIVVADLAKPEGARQLYDNIRNTGINIDVLANNAGAGVFGDFATETYLEAELGIIKLNVSSVVALAKYFGREMADRGRGKILFTASEASLAPIAHMNVYAATKAFVYSFALALREELKGKGVGVTALMPGATDTGFFTRARMQDTELVRNGGLADPAKVARDGYDALMKGDGHIVTPLKDRVRMTVAKLVPDEMKVQTIN
jgi:short-subunit dehydrogenase